MKEPDRGWVGLGSSFIVEDMLAQEDNQYPQWSGVHLGLLTAETGQGYSSDLNETSGEVIGKQEGGMWLTHAIRCRRTWRHGGQLQ